MPLDALLTPDYRRLANAVPLEALEAHRQAQLERFAPSFWHQHQAWLPVGLIGSVGCMAASGGIANGALPDSLLPSWLCVAWLGVIGLLILFGVFRASAGAHWEERCVAPWALEEVGVPTPVASLARSLCDDIPGATLILGELKQEEIVLDPYLLITFAGERNCLGIWDGDRIIAAA